MQIVSHAPFPATLVTWSRKGSPSATVVAKLTFDILPGTSRLAAGQLPLFARDETWAGDPARSVYAPNDLAPFKQRPEVMLVGNAYAPGGEPARAVVARIVVAGLEKAIDVHCDRVQGPTGKVLDGEWFVEMDLGYERAAGGPGTDNPIGIPPDAPGDDEFGVRLPNLETFGDRSGARRTAGFGPIAATWPERLQKAGRHAGAFRDGSWATRSLPRDLDPLYFQSAPADQGVEALTEGLRIRLDNLHRSQPRFVTQLPRVRPRAVIENGAALDEVALVADALWIDTSRAIATLTYRGEIERPGGQRVHVVLEEVARPLSAGELRRQCNSPAQPAATPRRKKPITMVIPPPAKPGDPPAVEETTCADETDSGDASPAWLKPVADGVVATPPIPAALPPATPRASGVQAVAPAPAPPPSPPAPVWTTPAHVSAEGYAQPPSPRASRPDLDDTPYARAAFSSTAGIEAPLAIPIGSNPAAGGHASVLGLSNAAAATEAPAPSDRDERGDLAAALPAPPAAILDVLWVDAEAMPRVRETTRWVERISACRPPTFARDADGEPLPIDPVERDRGDALAVLSGAPPTHVGDLAATLVAAANSARGFKPPLILVVGELAPSFDEVDTLKATLGATSPFIGPDKKLKEACDVAKELLGAAALEGATDVVEGLTARVRDAFQQGGRGLPPNFLDLRVERTLLKQRRYAKVTVLGATWTRAQLVDASSSQPVPVYVPVGCDTRLPMFRRFPVRAIAEVHLSQDQFESHPYALRVIALAREGAPLRG